MKAEPGLTVLDRAIAWLSPGRGLARAQARVRIAALEQARAYFDGATRGRRTEGWRTPSTDANAELAPALRDLRDRARDFRRNNPYARRGVSAVANNVVGAGVTAKIVSPDQNQVQALNELRLRWMETAACDADGRHDLYGLQHSAMATVVEAGECLIRRRPRRRGDGLPVPMQLQVIEPDYLDSTRDGPTDNGGYMIQGVQLDFRGRRLGYWLHGDHPGGGRVRARRESRFVPADEVIHLFRVDRRGQQRGVPWLAPVMIKLRDLADYQDAQLVRQKIAACFAVFEEVEEGNDDQASPALERIEPGLYHRLKPGRKITVAAPPAIEGYNDYSRVELGAIAAGLEVPYEVLTGDLSNVNFSSGRMGWLEFQRSVDVWRWHMLVPQMLEPIALWFLAEADPIVRSTGARIEWTPPVREMISPKDEVPATRDAIRAGLESWAGAVRARGYDPDALLAEIKEYQDKLDLAEIVLDSDPRHGKAGEPAGAEPAEPEPARRAGARS